MSRVLVASLAASSAYISYQLYTHLFTEKFTNDDLINLNQLKTTSDALTTPFPPQIELLRQQPPRLTATSLCDSLQKQFKFDWNRAINFLAERI